MENHHDGTLKKFVSDPGGEFLNEKFNSLSRDCGFRHIFAPPETPPQNGFDERANHTIVDKACCRLGASNLPKMYWEEAVNTAAMLSNILPTPSRLNNSTYTLWTDSKILTTKHVAFDESILPCLKTNETTNPCSIIIEELDPAIITENHLTKDPITETDESQPLHKNRNAPSEPEDNPLAEEEPSSYSLPALPPANP
ncbi:hypothetical protein O181_006686 [Austropuccinia psidii MF-1]|uniref:Integrase catalytic domain-containing protein n=1 Tax=Austropuccinia psidii MF-1 TaxID=1389203 RepID=A0A9Q3BLC7_9BASI|nr:hypothetical protein [Austropuccinia psidii MF-1]